MVSVAKTMVNMWLPWFNNSIVFGFTVKSLLISAVFLSALAPPKLIIKQYDYLSAKLLCFSRLYSILSDG